MNAFQRGVYIYIYIFVLMLRSRGVTWSSVNLSKEIALLSEVNQTFNESTVNIWHSYLNCEVSASVVQQYRDIALLGRQCANTAKRALR